LAKDGSTCCLNERRAKLVTGSTRFAYYSPDRIRTVVGFEDITEAVARAFADHGRGLGDAPIAIFAPGGREGDVHVKSAWLPGRAIFTVKIATWFAART
jgi:ornithine cyclodeaminase